MTVIAAVADCPPALTVTTVLPAVEPVTDTAAPVVALRAPTDALEELQLNATPLRRLFDASYACAVKLDDAPVLTDALDGETVTRAIAAAAATVPDTSADSTL